MVAQVSRETLENPNPLERQTYRRNTERSSALPDVAILVWNNAHAPHHAARYSHERLVPSPVVQTATLDTNGKTTSGQKQTEGKNREATAAAAAAATVVRSL